MDIDMADYILSPSDVFQCIGMVVEMEDVGEYGFFTDTGRYVVGGFATQDAASIARDDYFLTTAVKH